MILYYIFHDLINISKQILEQRNVIHQNKISLRRCCRAQKLGNEWLIDYYFTYCFLLFYFSVFTQKFHIFHRFPKTRVGKIMLEELDEDTHLCIKCGLTIVGLENYVRHRKTSCSKRVRPAPLPLNREVSIDAGHSYREFEFSELDEHNADASQNQKSGAFKSEPSKSLSESYDYNDGLGADVFFSLLNLQSSSKSKQNLTATAHNHESGATVALAKANDVKVRESKSVPIHDEWIGRAATSGTEKLMKAVNAISGTKKMCFETPNSMYSYEYPHDHDSPEPPAYDDDDDEEIVDEDDYIAPPHTHTGGKWKPSERNTRSLATSSARWYERWDIPDEVSQLQMPAASTSTEELPADEFQPPSSHTKGKWVPGTKIIKLDYKNKERSEFWCNACNRKLSSSKGTLFFITIYSFRYIIYCTSHVDWLLSFKLYFGHSLRTTSAIKIAHETISTGNRFGGSRISFATFQWCCWRDGRRIDFKART